MTRLSLTIVICILAVTLTIIPPVTATGTAPPATESAPASVPDSESSRATVTNANQTSSETPLSGQPSERWNITPNSTLVSPPAVANSHVYIATADTVYAFNTQTGETAWTWSRIDSGTTRLIATPTTVYVVPQRTRGTITALNTTDGSVQFTDPGADGDYHTDVTYANETLYVAAHQQITAYNGITGERHWRYDTVMDGRHGRTSETIHNVVANDDIVALVTTVDDTDTDYVRALHAPNGTITWERQLPQIARTTPRLTNRTFYIDADNTVHALNDNTGTARWTDTPFGTRYRPPAVTQSAIVFPDYVRDDVDMYDRSTGNRTTGTWVAYSRDDAPRTTIAATQNIIVWGQNGSVHARSLDGFTKLWSYPLTNPPDYSTPKLSTPVIANDTVYVTSNDTTLHALTGTGDTPPVRANVTIAPSIPRPDEAVTVNATRSTGVAPLTYEWFVNNKTEYPVCTSANCTLTPDYPVNVTVRVTDALGRTATQTRTLRASTVTAQINGTSQDTPVLLNGSYRVTLNNETLNHDVRNVTWSFTGPIDHRSPQTITFTDTGQATIRIQATLETQHDVVHRTDQLNVTVHQYRPRTAHYEFHYGDNVDPEDKKTAIAAQDGAWEADYTRLNQRLPSVPDTVNVHFVTDLPMGCEGAAACASPPNHISIRFSGPGTMAHELTHLAQYNADIATSGEWAFIAEGHAEYESRTPIAPGLHEKPTVEELKDWNREYTEAARFVDALFREYGRQTTLQFLRGSAGTDLETRFQQVFNQSLDSFHARWNATAPVSKPYIRPRFVYYSENDTLSTVGADRYFEDISVSWDIDDDGTFERHGRTINWTPESAGDHQIRIRYEQDGHTAAQTQVISIANKTDPLASATDPDGDGQYEDVNGNGRLDIGDVQALYAHLDESVTDRTRFDFNGNGELDLGDVQALFADIPR